MNTITQAPPSPLQGGKQPPQIGLQPQYEITDNDRNRIKKIEAAWKAYEGCLDKPLTPVQGQPDDNVLSNRMMQVVDRGVDFLFGLELEISIEEGAPAEAQDFLNQTWGRKEKRIPLLQKLAMHGAIAGTAFLRIVPDNQGNFRLVTVDPSTVYVKTAPQDCDTVLLWCIEYSTNEKVNGSPQKCYYREEIVRIDPDGNASKGMPDSDDTWLIQHWTRIGDKGPWIAAGDPIPWLYEFPPIFACQNLPNPCDFWGYPDITPDLIGLNEALNLIQSCINRANKLYGHPIIYATGVGESSIDIRPGQIIALPLSESKISAVPISADIANALQFANNLRSDIDEQTGVPGVATGRIADLPRGSLSGILVELLFMPLLKKNDKKRCNYGELILDVSQALLVLNNFTDDIEITLNWQSPLPSDDLQTVQAALLKQQLGISSTELQREMGYDPEEQFALNQSEDEKKLTSFMQGKGMPPSGQPANGQPPSAQPQTGQPGQSMEGQ